MLYFRDKIRFSADRYFTAWVSALIFAVSLSACNASDNGNATPGTVDDLNDLDNFIQEQMESAHIPGLAGAIVVGDEIVWAKGYGTADLSTGRAVTADTLFVMASVSKTMTAAALMRAVESGAIGLDDDVNSYLPFALDNPQTEGEVITPRHLATHTSGILDSEYYDSEENYHMGGDNPIALGEFLQEYLVAGGRFYDPEENFDDSLPGDYYEYSNTGTALAGYLLEFSAGLPLDQYCEQHIFEPLGMSSTGWHIADVDMSNHAIPYTYEDDEYSAYQHYGLATWPDGGLRTSVRDLGRFLAMVMNNGELDGVRVLEAETVAEMLYEDEDNEVPDQAIFWYGLDDEQGNLKYIGHEGSDPGTATFMAFDPEEKIGVLGFANSDTDDLEAIMHRLFAEGVRLKGN